MERFKVTKDEFEKLKHLVFKQALYWSIPLKELNFQEDYIEYKFEDHEKINHILVPISMVGYRNTLIYLHLLQPIKYKHKGIIL